MGVWEDARVKHTTTVSKLEKKIPGYGYSDSGQAKATDEKIKAHLVENLRDAKSKLFDIIEFLFEIQSEKLFGKDLGKLRDGIDIFSDNVKVHHIEWKELPVQFLELLLKHDSDLIKGTEAIETQVEEIYRLSVGYQKVGRTKVFDNKRLDQVTRDIFSLLKALDISFRERAALFDIRERDMLRAYGEIKEEIARKF